MPGAESASACLAATSVTTPFWRSRPLRPSPERPYRQPRSTRSCPELACQDALEVVLRSPAVVLDGAHNPGVAALGHAIREAFSRHHPKVLLCGGLSGRDPVAFLDQPGASDFDFVVATQPPSSRALPAGVLGRAARSSGLPGRTDPDPRRALERAIHAAGSNGVVLATWSLHLAGLIRTMTRGA